MRTIKPKRIEMDHNILFGTCECGNELIESDVYCDKCGAKIDWPKKRNCRNNYPGCEELSNLNK